MTLPIERRAATRLGGLRTSAANGWTRAIGGAAVAWALCGAGTAHAAALQISPIRLDLSAAQPAAVLTLHNRGTTAIDAQVRVFAWSQTPDDDHLEHTERVVASPPIVSIPPDSDQTVRILRTASDTVDAEETYRLLIDEIPSAPTARSTAVRVQLRYSVPVFVGAPVSEHPPTLAFALLPATRPASTGDSGAPSQPALALSASNLDIAHAQISQVRIDWPGGQHSDLASGLLGYALPHNQRRWLIKDAPPHATSGVLHAVVNGTPLTRKIGLDSQRASAAGESSTP